MPVRQTANAKDLQKDTPAVMLRIGATPETRTPRPDLAGLRVKLPNQPDIYLIDPDGYRRAIPNAETYNNLFRDWNGVVVDIDIDDIPDAAPISDGAVLARAGSTSPVWFVSNGVKRWITSSAAMSKYYFNWSKVCSVPHVLVDFLPTGASWG